MTLDHLRQEGAVVTLIKTLHGSDQENEQEGNGHEDTPNTADANAMSSGTAQSQATFDLQTQVKSALNDLASQWSEQIQPEAIINTTDATKPAGVITFRGLIPKILDPSLLQYNLGSSLY